MKKIPIGGNFKNDLAFSNIAPVEDLIVQSFSCGNNVMNTFKRDNSEMNEYIFKYSCDNSSKADKKNCRTIDESEFIPSCYEGEKLTDVRFFQDFKGPRYTYTCCKYF